ncbi:unnamed protein product [Adineta steineri]|uniref:Uncharacterized protein n=1 Tax=Adineta steineri TaxID=433720 RepID=A0A818Y8S8_9BILA|nr:unnamed protein product [Adineta steineri]CAF3749354.1 unnamed protein product [Adineta steineri]
MVIIKDKLKIKIVENNNEALPIYINDIGENLKSDEDIALIRFDTYADFLVPKNVQADEIETLDHLIPAIDNQCWILPAVYLGLIKKIFWFKPPWAHQFQDGLYQLQIGKCQQTGVLKVASTIPYFTSNCVYSSIDKLSNIQTVDLYVSTSGLAKNYATTIEKAADETIYNNDSGSESLDSDNRKKPKLSINDTNHKDSQSTTKRVHSLDATLINELLENKQFLMDIDLSFFSTDDSIRKQFDENEYEILRYVYTRIVQEQTDPEIVQYITARESALEQIRTLMNEYLTDPKPDQPILVDNIYLSALISVIRHKKLDWKLIHNYGMHLADTRPPLHVSSEGMIIYLLESMTKILESIKPHPVLITISRCVEDGHCSEEQADLIQLHVEKKLQKLYKIEETIGKSLSKSLTNDENIEDEINDDDNSGEKSLTINNDESKQELNIDTTTTTITTENKADSTEIPTESSKSDTNLNNQASPSPPRSNLSPGEIKAVSPSSLSEASPISN